MYLGLDLSGWSTNSENTWKSNDWVLSRVASTEQSADTKLTSTETFGPSQWIVDVKRTDASGEIQFHLGDIATLRSSDPEIAAILGCSVAAVDQRLHRAKERLAKQYHAARPQPELRHAAGGEGL